MIILTFFFLGISSCNDVYKQENEELKREISILEDSLERMQKFYHFEYIKPMILPGVDNFYLGDTIPLHLFLAADNNYWHGKTSILSFEASSSKNSKVNLSKDGFAGTLLYVPDSKGIDTLSVQFNLIDQNQNKVMSFPSTFTIDVKSMKKEKVSLRF